MRRRNPFSICIALIVLAGVAYGISWDDGSGVNNYWSTPTNWDPNGIPGPNDNVTVGPGFAEARYPAIPSGYNAYAGTISIVGNPGPDTNIPMLTIQNGGKLTSGLSSEGYPQIFMLGSGWGDGGQGILNNFGGDVNVTKLWVGYRDLGILNMTGGTINVLLPEADTGGFFEVARGDDCPCTSPGDPCTCAQPVYGNGYVHLDGGVIECEVLNLRKGHSVCGYGPYVYWPGQQGWVDITGGTLIIRGDMDDYSGIKLPGESATDRVLYYYNNGWLTAYGEGSMDEGNIVTHPRAQLVVDYDWRNPNKTTVTAYKASPGEAYELYPPPYTEYVGLRYVTLTWKPGDYVAYGGGYLGSPNPQKGNGHHVFFHTNESWVESANLNYPIGTQYGHIIGAQDSNYFSIEANYPGSALQGNTVYYWRVIEANDKNAPNGEWYWKSAVQQFRTWCDCPAPPYPPCGATIGIGVGEPLQVNLQWVRGYYTADTNGHQVYFGTDFNEVNDANTNDPQYQGAVSDSCWLATGLKLGMTYYWRIDEVNEAGPHPYLWRGDTWNFTVGKYRVVDEFSTYPDNASLRAAWAQEVNYACAPYGNGAIVSRDAAGQNGAGMRFEYDNNDRYNDGRLCGLCVLGYFSEVNYMYASGTDWTYGDADTTLRALALAYKGAATNNGDPSADSFYNRMYVAVQDAAGNMAIVFNEDPNAVQKTSWDEWNIDLRDFNDAGVNLTSVKYLYLGFGVRCNMYPGTPGGQGVVVFDNIRLYPPRCLGEPGYRQPGDLTGDCVVNLDDLDLMTDAWLMQDLPWWVYVDPNDPNMLVRYQFEGNYNNDLNGRVGAAGNGTPMGTPSIVYDAVRDGNVLYTDQEGDVNDYVVCGTWGQDGNFAGKSFTIVFWANQKELSTESGGWGDMVAKGESYQKVEFGSVPYLERQVHCVVHSSGVIVSSFKLDLNRWYHIVATYQQYPDMNGGMQRLYINGILDGENDMNEIPYGNSRHAVQWADPNWTLGAQEEEGNLVSNPPTPISIQRPFHGYLDDVRVYDRLLSEQEVRWLWNPWYWPQCDEIPYPYSEANIYVDPCPLSMPCCQRIDLKDFTLLAHDWLEWDLWPSGSTP